MKLTDWLNKKYTAKTAQIYHCDITTYIKTLGKEKALSATYKDVMNYLGILRKRYTNPRTITRILYAIKAYYYWMVHTGQRQDHPCRYIRLRDAAVRQVKLQDLFTPGELELLMERKERFPLLKLKNQAIMSLLIYQALTLGEITSLTVQDINLEKGTVHIKPTGRTNGRTLPLMPVQVMLFYKYIYEVRTKLLKDKDEKALILTIRGTPERGEGISYLLETCRDRFPGRKVSAQAIRMSVLANKLKAGEDLRKVQAFAGHKKISSTERYRHTNTEKLLSAIDRFHPLK